MARYTRAQIMEQALATLLLHVNSGQEYPDAHTDTCRDYNLALDEGDQLTDMYDNYEVAPGMDCIPSAHTPRDRD